MILRRVSTCGTNFGSSPEVVDPRGINPRRFGAIRIGWTVSLLLLFGGCSVRYSDPDAGVEHIWGFTHVELASPPQREAQAVSHGIETFGAVVGLCRSRPFLLVGWDDERQVVVPDPTRPVHVELRDGSIVSFGSSPEE